MRSTFAEFPLAEEIVNALDEVLSDLPPNERSLVADYLKFYPPDEQLAAIDELIQRTWRQNPVGIRQFIEDPYYLNLKEGGRSQIYPKLVDDLEELFEGGYTEAILTGGIGWGKSSFARLVHLYQLHQLGCLVNPARAYNLEGTSRIVLINVAINKTNATEVVFNQVGAAIDKSPWFTDHMPRVREKMDYIAFENGVWLAPFAANEKAIVGYDAIGGVMDEVNEMAYTMESSKKHRGEAIYDQAQTIRDALVRRMISRFSSGSGKLPGILVQMSSAKYPGEYTERRMDEAKEELAAKGATSIFTRQYHTWQTNPSKFSKTPFRLALATASSAPKILRTDKDEKAVAEAQAEIVLVPDNLLPHFERDIHSAIRDFVGRSTAALTPFINRPEKIFDAQTRGLAAGLMHPFKESASTLIDGGFLWAEFRPRFDPRVKYFLHGDLAKNKNQKGDRAGVAIGHIAGKKLVTTHNAEGQEIHQWMPHYVIDLMIQVKAPPEDEIRVGTIKNFIFELKSYGMQFETITFDSWQSLGLIQDLKDAYAATAVYEESVDRTNYPYQELKDALFDDRIDFYDYPVVVRELTALEKNSQTGKVDHPTNGSKDVADCVAAVVWAMLQFRPAERPIMMKSYGNSGGGEYGLDRILNAREQKAARDGVPIEGVRITVDDMLFADAELYDN